MVLSQTSIAGVVGNEKALGLMHTASALPLVLHARVVSRSGGGPEKTILNSPRFLKEHEYDCVCIYLRDPSDAGFQAIEQRAEEMGAPLIAVDDKGPSDWKLLQRLRELLECWPERTLIWHGHDYKSNLLGIWFQRMFQLKLVTTVHGWVQKTWKTPLYYAIDRFCLHRYERVICVSPDLCEACVRAGVSKERLRLIDNAIDHEAYRRSMNREQAKRLINWPADRLLIGAVGRLSAEKAFEDLIAATEDVIASGIDAGLVIVGDGPERTSLGDRVAQSPYRDRIQLAGYIAKPETYFQAMDVFALSSIREGLPNVLLEAMAYEVPVVATRVAGVPRLVQTEENGRLVSPGDPSELADALKDLLSDPQERRRLGDAGRETTETKFSFARRMEKVAAVYQEI